MMKHCFKCPFFLLILLILAASASGELQKQVLINVEFWEITHVNESEMGVDYRWNNKDGDLLNSSLYLPGPGNNKIFEYSSFSGNILDLHYGTLTLKVQLGIFENRATLLSSPKIIVINGQEAYFTTGDSVPYTTRQENTNNLVTKFYDTGVKLTVVPLIQADNFVQLQVQPEFSVITEFRPESVQTETADVVSYELPVIAERKAKTNVLVKSGSKFILGGLLSEKNIQTSNRVPFLGSIPVLGLLFSSRDNQKRISELVIAIQPIILDPKKEFEFPQKFTKDIEFELKGRVATEPTPTPTPFIPMLESEPSENVPDLPRELKPVPPGSQQEAPVDAPQIPELQRPLDNQEKKNNLIPTPEEDAKNYPSLEP